MSRFKLAFENADEIAADETAVDEVSAMDDSAVQELEVVDAELTSNEAEVSEAEDIGDGLGKVEEMLEASVATDEAGVEGEGISPETAEAVEIATEHFAKRLNVNYRVLPSLESFGDGGSRAATLTALKRVKSLQTAVESSIVVANEGIVDDVKTAISMAFETSEKVLHRNNAVANRDFNEGSTFTNDTWAKYIPTKQASLTAADVVKIAEDAARAGKSDKVAALVTEFIEGIKKATTKIRDIWFWSNARDIAEFKTIGEKINAVAEELTTEAGVATAGRSTAARSFTAPTKQEAKKIAKAVEVLLNESSLEPLVKQLESKDTGLRLWSWWNTGFRFKNIASTALLGAAGGAVGRAVGGAVIGGAAGRILGSMAGSKAGGDIAIYGSAGSIGSEEKTILDNLNAEDLTAGRDAIMEARKALVSLRKISVTRVKLASALVSYLERSAK